MNGIKKLIFNRAVPALGRIFLGRNKYVNVIYYHDIVDGEGEAFMKMGLAQFTSQMQFLADNGYRTLLFSELDDPSKLKFDKKTVLITFDDGWKSNYDAIFPLMQSLGLRYNIFLTMGCIGKNPEYLDWDTVRLMKSSGVVDFGVHTVSHPDCSDISKIDPAVEFDSADRNFKEQLGFAPKDFCYPTGLYSDSSNDYISKNCIYSRIYTSDKIYSYPLNGKIIFGRNAMNADWDFRFFVLSVKGCYNIFNELVKCRR